MRQGPMNPAYMQHAHPEGVNGTIEAWGNDVYDATVERRPDGWDYISLKRKDRHAIRDWRHLQSIKNEICGPEREAVELFPAESRLMDTSNQHHLWVAPEGMVLPWGQHGARQVMTAREIREFNAERQAAGIPSKARQRDWQPGLSTGPREAT